MPKFEEDAFHIPSKDYFLVPTAEVPLTNIYRDEILDEKCSQFISQDIHHVLDKKQVLLVEILEDSYRNHQFDKVEWSNLYYQKILMMN